MRPREPEERDALARELEADPGASERRRFARSSVRLRGHTRRSGQTVPCTVIDFSAGGLRLRNDGAAPLERGQRLMVSVDPEGTRVDWPVQVRHVTEDGVYAGVQFCGAPLVLRHPVSIKSTPHTRQAPTAEIPRAA
jgi:hypothetical protein